MSNLLGFVFVAVGAAAAWVVLNFVGNPVREFFSLRRDVRRQMLLYGNVSGPVLGPPGGIQTYPQSESAKEAHDKLRDLAVQLLSFKNGEPVAARFVHLFGYDLEKAGNALIGLSNYFESGQYRHVHVTDIEAALKF